MKTPFPVEAIATYIERLERAQEAADPAPIVVEIAEDLAALAAGDDPVWGAIAWRAATGNDPEDVQAAGWKAWAAINKPSTYRDVRKMIDLYEGDPYKTVSRGYRVVPFDKQQERVEAKLAELTGARETA